MDRVLIETRLEQLKEMRQAQAQRLQAAQQEQRDALASLERIEGAVQDCQFWLANIAEREHASAESNGAANEVSLRN